MLENLMFKPVMDIMDIMAIMDMMYIMRMACGWLETQDYRGHGGK
jgi:hypothetical protein